MNVTTKGEYNEVISRYLQSSFPEITAVKGKDLLEVLTQVVVGCKDLRYGPIPPPERLVNIRKTLASSIVQNLPIPFLVPWGGRKMDPTMQIDVAEVSAIRQLIRLDDCIRKFHKPGGLYHFRIEDIGAQWLYKTGIGIEEYSSSLKDLIDMLKGHVNMVPLRESQLMKSEEYNSLSWEYSSLLYNVLSAQIQNPKIDVNSLSDYQKLVKGGWKGEIPKEQRDYYLERYRKLYPDENPVSKLADYFAGSKARYDLNGRAEPKTAVGSFIQLNFAHPVPGAPDGIFSNTLYFRTIPTSMGRTHIAPWRAKGYISIIGNYMSVKLVNPGSLPMELESNVVVFENEEGGRVDVEADYFVNDSAYAHIPFMM